MKNYSTFLKPVLVSLFLLFSVGLIQAQSEDKPYHSSKADSIVCSRHGVHIVKNGPDSMVIVVNKHDVPDFRHNFCHSHKHGYHKFNGHWAGIDLGINGYVNDNFNMDLPSEYKFLNINTASSWQVNLNPCELNFNLIRNHFGLVSGLGFQINNYVFSDKSYYLSSDYPSITAFRIYDQNGNPVGLKKSKMVVCWVNIPLMLEYQTNSHCFSNSFHISAGVIGGARIGQYTKQYYPAANTTYYLEDLNGYPAGSFTTNKEKSHDHSQYHLNPFKVDLTARIGWSFLNFWADYSLTPMFQDKQGPEIYPWAIGITLLGW
ncbi:MAG: outer membrane beta-barrel protein [Bacteroidota bacterium]|nr:outer membrane beta-barrel protein [Bacteroidota bacterium]